MSKDLRNNQRGSSIIVVTIIGTIITLVFAVFINSTLLVERRAVETSLAEIRSYWAAMGHLSYGMARITKDKLCPVGPCPETATVDDTELATRLDGYFQEITAYESWTYPDEATEYNFDILIAVAPDDDLLKHPGSGHLMATASYALNPSAPPILDCCKNPNNRDNHHKLNKRKAALFVPRMHFCPLAKKYRET